jgi:hypothetical protein
MKTSRVFLLVSALLLPALLSAAEKSAARVDPKALEQLQRMSDTLASARSFTYESRSLVEVPSKTGQFLTLYSDARVALQRPDKLRARLGGEAPAFDFYFNGRTVSAFAPGPKVYSRTAAPATIDAMLPELEAETGIRFVTAPLLFSDPYRVLTRNLTSGIVVGPVWVHGVFCTHLAFCSPGVNWEIWIEAGSKALPKRLAVTFTDRPNAPRTIVEFSKWNLHPWLRARDFQFHPPAQAKEIPFRSVWKSTGR